MKVVSFIYRLLFDRNPSNQNNSNLELFHTDEYLRPNHQNLKECPKCRVQAETNKDVIDIFGLMMISNKTYIQSWCRKCRKNKDKDVLSEIDLQEKINLKD